SCEDSSLLYTPFTSTTRWASRLGIRAFSHALPPSRGAVAFNAYDRLTSGCTLVYFQSSFFTVGKPVVLKRSSACLRISSSEPRAPDARRPSTVLINWVYNESLVCVIMVSVATPSNIAPPFFQKNRGLGINRFFKPVVTLFFQLQRQFLSPRTDNAAVIKDVHKVGHDVLQQPLVVGNEHKGIVFITQLVHTPCHDAERIDIQARVGLIKNGQLGFQHRQLQNLITLFLATRKPFVQRPVGQFGIKLDQLLFFLHHLKELPGLYRRQPLIGPYFIECRFQEVDVR